MKKGLSVYERDNLGRDITGSFGRLQGISREPYGLKGDPGENQFYLRLQNPSLLCNQENSVYANQEA